MTRIVLSLIALIVFAPLASMTRAQNAVFVTATPAAPAAVVTAAPTQPPATPVSTPVQVFEPEACAYVEGQPTSQECIELMQQYPEPDVEAINPDADTLSRYSFWRVGPDPVDKYSGPGGGVIGQIPQGFNFVNAVDTTVEGWLQIEGGEWIQQSDAAYKAPSTFTGVQLPDGWNQPFAWVLDTTGVWASLYPGGPGVEESGLVPLHYERYNIFAEAEDEDGWIWYMVGPNQWVKQIYMAVIKPIERPEGVSGHWVAVDLFEQSLVAYEDDRPVFATLISTGLPTTETNEGLFTVWARLDRDAMSGATGAPNAYALQSVPWTMYFDGSISLHGTYWHDYFGYRQSRGCVNLSVSDARWVYEWFLRAAPELDGELINYVYVHSSGEYRRPV